jgi:hypothetical protein
VSDQWGQPQQQGSDWSVPQGGGSESGTGSGSFAPPPVDPQYGAPQQPQYGAPDPQYGGQPQFGGPVPPGGYGYPVAPQNQKNGFAVAGFVLSITAVLGLIFSLLGLNRAGKVGGKGRGLAVAGLVLSILFGIGWGVGIAHVANSTALDPGCTSAEASFRSMLGQLQTDESKLTADAANPTALQADLTTFTTDMQTVKSALDSSLAKSEHQSVKDKIQAMDTDLGTVLTGLTALQKGDTSQLATFEAAAGRLQADGNAVDAVCSSL